MVVYSRPSRVVGKLSSDLRELRSQLNQVSTYQVATSRPLKHSKLLHHVHHAQPSCRTSTHSSDTAPLGLDTTPTVRQITNPLKVTRPLFRPVSISSYCLDLFVRVWYYDCTTGCARPLGEARGSYPFRAYAHPPSPFVHKHTLIKVARVCDCVGGRASPCRLPVPPP